MGHLTTPHMTIYGPSEQEVNRKWNARDLQAQMVLFKK